mgnify:FL=1
MVRFYALAILLVLAFTTLAQQKATGILESRSGKVDFVSEAPLEIIKASSIELKGLIREPDRTFAFSISNRSFKGFNSPLQQEHFYENYIEATKYPVSTFEGKIIEPIDFSQNGEYNLRAKGVLDIHGVKQERVIKVKLSVKNQEVKAFAQFDVLLEDHKITIPKMVYQKLSEKITVTVSLNFQPKAD